MTHIEKITDKIKKCLRLADNKSATEGEVNSALRRAQALMTKHNITVTMSEIGDNGTGSDGDIVDHELAHSKIHDWMKGLASACCNAFDVAYYFRRGVAHHIKGRISFYGLTDNALMAKYAFESLINQVERLAKKYKVDKEYYYNQDHYRTFSMFSQAAKREYREALVRGLAQAVVNQKRDDKAEYGEEDMSALVVVAKDVQERTLKEHNINLHTRNSYSSAGQTNSDSHMRGLADSTKLHMTGRGIEGKK